MKDLAVQVLPRVKLDLIFGKCRQWNSERDTVTLNARRTKCVFKREIECHLLAARLLRIFVLHTIGILRGDHPNLTNTTT